MAEVPPHRAWWWSAPASAAWCRLAAGPPRAAGHAGGSGRRPGRQDAPAGGRRRPDRCRAHGDHHALGLRRDPGRCRQQRRRPASAASRCRCWRATPGADEGPGLDLLPTASARRTPSAVLVACRRRAATSPSATKPPHVPRLEGPTSARADPRAADGGRPGPSGLGQLAAWGRSPRCGARWAATSPTRAAPAVRPLRHLLRRLALAGAGHADAGGPRRASGVWSVTGGMHALALALAGLAERRGARVALRHALCNASWCKGRACGRALATAVNACCADSVVFNGDVSALATGTAGPELLRAAGAHAGAAAAFAVGRDLGRACAHQRLRAGAPQRLLRPRLRQRIRRHLQRPPPAARGTVYVCAQDRADGTPGAEGGAPRAAAVPGQRPCRGRPPIPSTLGRPTHAKTQPWTLLRNAACS
jgi:hypothetical protein